MILSDTSTSTTYNNNNNSLVMDVESSAEKLVKMDDSLESPPPLQLSNRFFVNTNDSCFLCLKVTSSLSSGFYSPRRSGVTCSSSETNCGDVIKREHVESTSSISSQSSDGGDRQHHDETASGFRHWNIFSYLNITPCSIVKSLEKGSQQQNDSQAAEDDEDDNSDFSVLICEDCAAVAIKMSKLCEELDLIQMRVDRCVESVQEIIAKSDNDPKRMEEFRDKETLAIRDGTESFVGEGGVSVNELHRKVVDLLRKETKEKCMTRLKSRRYFKSKQAKLLRSEYSVEGESSQINSGALEEVTSTATVEMRTKPLKMNESSGVLVLKKEDSLSPHSSTSVVVQDLQTEWTDCVPEVDQEISIGICDHTDSSLITAPTITSSADDLMLFQQLPSLPLSTLPTISEMKSNEVLMLKQMDPSTSLIHPSTILSNGILPPPPPPVNIPRKPRKTKKKKIKLPPNPDKTVSDSKIPTPITIPYKYTGIAQCPVDFYFHKKVDNRHHCLFCSDTSPTLTNLRFHVIRAHLEQLFSTSNLTSIPTQEFKATCEQMLAAITKESDTGLKNPSGTKAIVRCKFCRGNSTKIYHDKRAFQCHLILNHYQILTQRLMELQKVECNGENVAGATTTVPTISNPIVPSGIGGISSTTATNGLSLENASIDKRKDFNGLNNNIVQAKRLCIDMPDEANNGIVLNEGCHYVTGIIGKGNNGLFICEHCGKTFSSSGSKWRHKQQYCGVLRNRGDLPIQRQGQASSTTSVDVDNNSSDFLNQLNATLSNNNNNSNQPVTSSVYLITPNGEILGSSNVIRNAFITTAAATTTTMTSSTDSNLSSADDSSTTGLELLLQQANEMIMKGDNSCSGAEEVAEEYEQFVSGFQEFYDEDEVNDALLTMMMENVPEEDPLHI